MIYSIQYLRALAACAVVFHHTSWSRTVLGSSGVDLFFVISGYIMMHVSRREPSPAKFLRARVHRIWPIYAILTVLIAIVSQISVERVLASLLFLPDLQDPKGWPIIFQGWTLNIEVFFYLVFAAALSLPNYKLPAITAVLGGLAAFGIAFHPTNLLVAAYTNPMMLEFLLGCWLWVLFQNWIPGRVTSLGLVAAGAVLLLIQVRSTSDPGNWRPLVWGGPYALLLAGAVGLDGGHPWKLPKLLGDASYSLYLTHWYVLKMVGPLLKPLPTPVAYTAVEAVCCAVAVTVYLGLERPLLRLTTPMVSRASVPPSHPQG